MTFYQAATLCRWLTEREREREREREKEILKEDVLFGSGVIIRLNRHKAPRTVPTIKEQAATARAAGLKRFTADRPCKRGHVVRRADAKGTCITCDYLRNSATANAIILSVECVAVPATWRYLLHRVTGRYYFIASK
jgi:hypothetical protein